MPTYKQNQSLKFNMQTDLSTSITVLYTAIQAIWYRSNAMLPLVHKQFAHNWGVTAVLFASLASETATMLSPNKKAATSLS